MYINKLNRVLKIFFIVALLILIGPTSVSTSIDTMVQISSVGVYLLIGSI
jgi:hypothetical protein